MNEDTGENEMAERSWYIANAGVQQGPYPESQFLNFVAAGQINADTLVWTDGMAAWQRAGDIPGLMAAGRAPPSPPPRPLRGGASSPDVHPGGDAVTADFGVWALLGRVLLAGIGVVLIIPAPWAMTSYYRWFIAHLRVPTIPEIGFTGRAGDIWWVFVLIGLFAYAGVPQVSHHIPYVHHSHYLRLLVLLVEPVLSWLIVRWIVANLASQGQPLSARFAGSIWGFIGWNLLLYLSVVTIVGWAWVTTAFPALGMPQHPGGNPNRLVQCQRMAGAVANFCVRYRGNLHHPDTLGPALVRALVRLAILGRPRERHEAGGKQPQCPSKAMRQRTGTPSASIFLAPPRSGRSMTKQAATTSAPSFCRSFTARFRRAAGGDEIIDEDHLLARRPPHRHASPFRRSPYSSE